MAWPSQQLYYPSNVVFANNGRLYPSDLTEVMFHGCGMGKLHPATARAWFWLQTLCKNETGEQLTVSSLADAYRTYQIQEWTFRDRYRSPRTALCTWIYKMWHDSRWYKRVGVATAATPGTSNHGQGLALDVFLWKQNSFGTWVKKSMSTNSVLWNWMLVNAPTFGFYWNVSSENWHIEYCAGDNTPQRILDIEAWLGGIPA